MIIETTELCQKHRAKLSHSKIGDKLYYRCAAEDDVCFGEVEESRTESLSERKLLSNGSSRTEDLANDGQNGVLAANGNGRSPSFYEEVLKPQVKLIDPVDEWRLAVSYEAQALIVRGERDPEAIWYAIAKLENARLRPPTELSVSEASEEIQAVISRCLQPIEPADREIDAIIIEDYDAAVVANAEYLKREAIVERLFYTQSISLFVGGKHHGKTTIARTCAMSVSRGDPFLGREVKQGHVIYAASDDEVASTRMELLRMGWDGKGLSLVRINAEAKTAPDALLLSIAAAAKQRGTVLIVLDMLFDFAAIRDEMSYAGTREAIGKIQKLADLTGAHVASTHHSPKYMTDTISAGQAALGSQGIAARFSPIILTRKWADGLYTTESTMTRDPRGLALEQHIIELNEHGWACDGGAFKAWMKWKIWAPKVMGMFESSEPGTELTVASVAQELDINRPDAQNTLYRLHKEGLLDREKRGRGYRYWLPLTREALNNQTDMSFEERKYGGESQD